MKLPDEAQKFSAGEFFVNKRPIRNKPRDRFSRLGLGNDVVSVEQHSSGSRFQYSHHHADRGGLACAVGAEKAEYLTRGYFKIESVHGGQFAVALGDIDELNHNDLGFSILRLRSVQVLDFRLLDASTRL